MLFPSLCIDNFFQNPDKVVDYAKTFKYTPSKTGKWPGKRTESLHLIAPQIHRHVGRKVLATLFPNNYTKITYNLGDLYFQKISSEFCNTGWVHVDDPAELTIIIYLSKHKKCGTSIFDYVKAFPTNDESSKKKFNFSNSLLLLPYNSSFSMVTALTVVAAPCSTVFSHGLNKNM